MNKLMKVKTKPSPGHSFCELVYYLLFRIVFKMIPPMVNLGLFLLEKAWGDKFPPDFPEEEEVRYKSVYEERWLG
jgi:hypothetical protein